MIKTYRLKTAIFITAYLLLSNLTLLSARTISQMSGGGNFTNGETTPVVESQFKALNKVGAKMCRLNIYGYYDQYANPPAATPANLDSQILMAHTYGITPMLLFECYGRSNIAHDYNSWHAIGKAYAERFAPNSSWLKLHGITDWGISIYQAANEPDGEQALTLDDYYNIIKGMADGVHSVNANLKALPGGFMSENAFSSHTLSGYGAKLAPLFNDGTLDGIDLHTYNDVTYAPIELVAGSGEYRWQFSAQSDFEEVKQGCGITRDINFYATEFGFKRNTQNITDDYSAKRDLTSIWNNLGVVKNDGHTSATAFAFPWNIFITTTDLIDVTYAMCTQLDPWIGNPRGRNYQRVMQLAGEMNFVSLDPIKGEYVLEGANKKMWVWQNLPSYTNHPGTSFTVTGIPPGTTQLVVHGYDSDWNGPRKTITVTNETSKTITGLAEGQTYMIVATFPSSVAVYPRHPTKDNIQALSERNSGPLEMHGLDGRTRAVKPLVDATHVIHTGIRCYSCRRLP